MTIRSTRIKLACRDCKEFERPEYDEAGQGWCAKCGEPLVCDECGHHISRELHDHIDTPICDYGTEIAEWYVRDSAGEEPICTTHAKDHYGATWRQMVGRIGPLWHERQGLLQA